MILIWYLFIKKREQKTALKILNIYLFIRILILHLFLPRKRKIIPRRNMILPKGNYNRTIIIEAVLKKYTRLEVECITLAVISDENYKRTTFYSWVRGGAVTVQSNDIRQLPEVLRFCLPEVFGRNRDPISRLRWNQ